MRCIPHKVVNKSYVDFATLLSLESMWQAKEQLANRTVQCNQQLKCSWKQHIVGFPGSAFRDLWLEIKLKDT